MPRILIKRKRPLTLEEKKSRVGRWRPKGGLGFVDPFPWILGTRPEKIVYAFLMRTGIGFYFQTEVDASNEAVQLFQWYRPDFVIPSLRVVIEVQGRFWHTKEDTIVADEMKFILLSLAGYRVVTWWDDQIDAIGIPSLAAEEIPELLTYRGPRVGEVITENKEYTDDSAGIRTAAAKRKDWFNSRAKYKQPRRSTRSKSILSYDAR